MRLIDKDVALEEFKKRVKDCEIFDYAFTHDYFKAKADAYSEIVEYLNSIESKVVDLRKKAEHYLLYEHTSPLNEVFHQTDLKTELQYHEDIIKAYRKGFEDGLKAQKVE